MGNQSMRHPTDKRVDPTAGGAAPEPRAVQVAPGELELVRALLNTRNLETGTDLLATLPEARRWLRGTGLLARRDPLLSDDLAPLVALRETVRNALDPTHPHHPRGVARLNAILRSNRAYMQLLPDTSPAVVIPTPATVPDLSPILRSIVMSSVDGALKRLKICVNPHCRWAFYDPSRNISARWCDMSACGNRAKVHRYRQHRLTR
jgi:predicted RNA-binding Zn ribbon-like protein